MAEPKSCFFSGGYFKLKLIWRWCDTNESNMNGADSKIQWSCPVLVVLKPAKRTIHWFQCNSAADTRRERKKGLHANSSRLGHEEPSWLVNVSKYLDGKLAAEGSSWVIGITAVTNSAHRFMGVERADVSPVSVLEVF